MSVQKTSDEIESVVYHAIDGKYAQPGCSVIREIVKQVVSDHVFANVSTNPALSVEYSAAIHDAIRQATALVSLQKYRDSKQAVVPMTLRELHAAVFYSDIGDDQRRTEGYVADFEGTPSVTIDKISEAEFEIDKLLSTVQFLKTAGSSAKANFLAELFAKIINTHAFKDGNGRTARIAIQYCMCIWQLPFIPIPKVRNAPLWKASLDKAKAGELDGLVQYLDKLIGGYSLAEIEDAT